MYTVESCQIVNASVKLKYPESMFLYGKRKKTPFNIKKFLWTRRKLKSKYFQFSCVFTIFEKICFFIFSARYIALLLKGLSGKSLFLSFHETKWDLNIVRFPPKCHHPALKVPFRVIGFYIKVDIVFCHRLDGNFTTKDFVHLLWLSSYSQ